MGDLTFDGDLYATVRQFAAQAVKRFQLAGFGLDADDVAQQAALKILRGNLLARWRSDRGCVEAYLRVIVQSEALSLRRRGVRRRRAAQALHGAMWADIRAAEECERLALSDAVYQDSWVRERRAWVRERHAGLSPEARAVYGALSAGESRVAVRRRMGARSERRAWAELVALGGTYASTAGQ